MRKQILMVAALSLCLGQAMAQTDEPRVALPPDSLLGERPNFAEMPNPEEVAKRQTDRLKEALQLDEKQYEKVYELNLKEQKECLEERMQGPHLMGGEGRRPMPPGWDGQPPMEDDFPPQMGEGKRPPMPSDEDRKERAEELRKKEEKRAKKRNRKMKKILTDEQYARWKALPPEKPQPMHQPRPVEKESID